MIELSATTGSRSARVVLAPDAGGRVVAITVGDGAGPGAGGTELLASSPEAERTPWSTGWGSFPMAPWAGRIRNGRFRHGGRRIALALNHRDGTGTGGGTIHPAIDPAAWSPADDPHAHAIHGTVFSRPWSIDALDERSATLSCPLHLAAGAGSGPTAHPVARSWPFAGRAVQRIEVAPDRVSFELAVSSDGEEFPVTLGWHPWFAKPDRLDFEPAEMYRRGDDGLPTGELVRPGDGPWDDCFPHVGPVRLVYDRATAPVVTVDSDCDHLVVFDQPQHATCVEPQSGPPDAVNLPGRTPELAAPGHPVTRTMSISW